MLGPFGFAAATFMVATNLAGWYGSTKSGMFLFPFAATFGGIAQFAAGLWAYRARDALATASAFLGIGYLVGIHGWLTAGGWVLFASAICAFYTASAMMWKASFGRIILPLGTPERQANKPGQAFTHPIEYHYGEPGVRQGQ